MLGRRVRLCQISVNVLQAYAYHAVELELANALRVVVRSVGPEVATCGGFALQRLCVVVGV